MADSGAVTVSGLTKYIKSMLESDVKLKSFTVSGEVSNLTYHKSGHVYFALKDDGAVINAVMFKSSAATLAFKLESGMKVLARGRISVFEPSGRYQIIVSSMALDGVGDLYAEYERLKAKLQKEGLFNASHKRALPKIPSRIGVITSPTGAAVRDIINVSGRRFPFAKLIIYPSLVQGDGAPEQLIKALKYFEETKSVDVIIIGRGGGSIEDLWAFNDEALARAVYDMTIPVISAVGHEIDFTICDFVADMRAATPSAAAELAVPDTKELLVRFGNVDKRLAAILSDKTERCAERLERLKNSRVFTDKTFLTSRAELLLDHSTERLCSAACSAIDKKTASFSSAAAKLDALSPLKVLSRGYSLARDKDGNAIRSVSQLKQGDPVGLRLADGMAECTVQKIIEEDRL